MVIEKFPPLETADENGFLAIGGDFEVESLLLAYKSGIFPWPMEEDYITWFAPPKRFLLFLDEVKISKSLKKIIDNNDFEIRVNTNFKKVVESCREIINRGSQDGTWILKEMIYAYTALHSEGYATSIETYLDNKLVGGLYGVNIGAMFAGESMFYRVPNASKVALVYLFNQLKEKGVKWIDCQQNTPFLKSFGGREIDRDEFMKLLKESITKKIKLF